MKKKKVVTMEDFDNWLSECPVPYEQTCNGLNTTEYYSFNLIDCEMGVDDDTASYVDSFLNDYEKEQDED